LLSTDGRLRALVTLGGLVAPAVVVLGRGGWLPLALAVSASLAPRADRTRAAWGGGSTVALEEDGRSPAGVSDVRTPW